MSTDERYTLTSDDGEEITVVVVGGGVPTTAAPFHPTVTHVDVLGMGVAFGGLRRNDGSDERWSYYPTPCCGAAASISDPEYGMYCKACYEQVDDAFGGVPVEPLRLVSEVA